MKKISLGSFPLIEISGKDRKIFESYLIKVVSDLITANQLSNSIYMDRANFVTPLSILKFIKEDQKGLIGTKPEPGKETQQTDRDRKARVIKNAFKKLLGDAKKEVGETKLLAKIIAKALNSYIKVYLNIFVPQ